MATDEQGPMKSQTFPYGFKYFDLISFKSSRWLDAKFKRSKNDFYENLKDELKWVKDMKFIVKAIQIDDANLYNSPEYNEILIKNDVQEKRTTTPR